MARRSQPSRAFVTRDTHRKWLTLHFMVMAAGLATAFLANRFVTPQYFWAHWLAIAWGVIFGVHLVIFSRVTLHTMGGTRSR